MHAITLASRDEGADAARDLATARARMLLCWDTQLEYHFSNLQTGQIGYIYQLLRIYHQKRREIHMHASRKLCLLILLIQLD